MSTTATITETTTLADLQALLSAFKLTLKVSSHDDEGYREAKLEDVDGNKAYAHGGTLAEAIQSALLIYITDALEAAQRRTS